MNNQFFFMFSNGYYSDYCVGGLYVTDHEISTVEWKQHYQAYCDEAKAVDDATKIAYGKRTGCGHITHTDHRTKETTISLPNPWWSDYWASPERQQVVQWQRENNPKETFRKLHNMQPVHYEELWRD